MKKITEWIIKIWEDGKDKQELAYWLRGEIVEKELFVWERGMPIGYEYQCFQIPKRRKNGYREIEAPNEKLKDLQKFIQLDFMYKKSWHNVHKSACGFVPARSIVDAAKKHVGKEVVINMDLKDFFHSTPKERVENYFRRSGWGKTAAKILTNICTYNGSLPVGAPTSPALTNLINYSLDVRLEKLAKKFGGDYSRYADDITFSFGKFGGREKIIIKIAMKILREYGYQVQMKKKIRIQRKHQKQTVTGLVVNEKVNLDRKLKRQIRVMEHKKAIGILPTEKENELAGYLAFRKMVETNRV